MAGPPGSRAALLNAVDCAVQKDAPTSWAAYVAGALVVLARECGVRWGDAGISIFIHSDVPEGALKLLLPSAAGCCTLTRW
jgi:galactokinase